MFDLIYRLPEELEDAFAIARAVTLKPTKQIKTVIVAGMGGSGIGGDILQALLFDRMPVIVVKDYVGPGYINKNTLVFVVSYSGDTEETLSFYEKAKTLGVRIICLSSNGELAKCAIRDGFPLIKLPSGYPPRAAIAYLFLPMLVILNRLGITRDPSHDIKETIALLKEKRDEYNKRAGTLTTELVNKIPIIYSTVRLLDPVAYRWRCQFNENAKVLAHTHSFPELDHNEIMGMGWPAALAELVYLLILHDPVATFPKNRKRVQLTLEILQGCYSKTEEFTPDGKSRLARIFSAILFGDLLSYHLAVARGIDPLPVDRIEILKKRLQE